MVLQLKLLLLKPVPPQQLLARDWLAYSTLYLTPMVLASLEPPPQVPKLLLPAPDWVLKDFSTTCSSLMVLAPTLLPRPLRL